MAETASRLEALKLRLIDRIPCDSAARDELLAMPINDVLRSYLIYSNRFIPPRPRGVAYLPNFWTAEAAQHIAAISEIERKLIAGEDLTPHLSRRVHRNGYIKEKGPRHLWGDHKDFVLNAYGIHHLHLKPNTAGSELLFVRLWRREACLLFLGNHKSFDDGAVSQASAELKSLIGDRLVGEHPEHREAPTRTKMARKVMNIAATHGADVVMESALMLDRVNFFISRHADHIALLLEEIDPTISDRNMLISKLGDTINSAPDNAVFRWDLHYSDIMLIEERTTTGYLLCPGPL